MSELKAAVVGAGILGKRYARVLHELDGVVPVAVMSRTAASAEPLAAAYGVPAFTDLERMLDTVSCDVVCVATPDHLHLRPVLAALERGLHVIVEKPLATTVADARMMVNEADARGLVLQVNYSQRFAPEYAWMRECIAAGAIGRVALVQWSKQDTIFVPTKMIGWAAHTSPVFFMTSHELDLVCWFLGAPATSVSARERRGVLETRGIAAHDAVDALVAFADGTSAAFHTSWIHPESWPQLVTETATIVGEHGAIRYENVGRRLHWQGIGGGGTIEFTAPHTATEVDGRLMGAFRTSLEVFLAAVRNGSQPETSAARTLHVVELQAAILHAARSSARVTLA